MPVDINDRNDIIKLVNKFYETIQTDTLLAPFFSHLDWPKHLPIMYNFWSSMMFGEQTYRANPFEKHIHLQIKKEHFAQWLNLFTQTVDRLFIGPRAEEIKIRAQSIAGVFEHKLALLSKP